MVAFLFVFSAVVFFMPEGGGYFLEFNNFIPADPLTGVVFHALLFDAASVTHPLFGLDAKFWGVIVMGAGW